ncbi:hypothetical protein E2C01_050705 [Portunus trituberculatus]|uniref:Uncharacterized protein n=1 Tax=Portunus trituberculatus TaxID=210409 RepID=A0A5B7GGU7_PORTR|nr:hypothetical protein [Portunus trituberculatus]
METAVRYGVSYEGTWCYLFLGVVSVEHECWNLCTVSLRCSIMAPAVFRLESGVCLDVRYALMYACAIEK